MPLNVFFAQTELRFDIFLKDLPFQNLAKVKHISQPNMSKCISRSSRWVNKKAKLQVKFITIERNNQLMEILSCGNFREKV